MNQTSFQKKKHNTTRDTLLVIPFLLFACYAFDIPKGAQRTFQDEWKTIVGKKKSKVMGYELKPGSPVSNLSGSRVIGVIPLFYLQVQDANGLQHDVEISSDDYYRSLWKKGDEVWIREQGEKVVLAP